MISGREKIDGDDVSAGCPSTTIDNTTNAIMSILLDEDRQMMVWEIKGASGTKNNIPHFNWISDEEKGSSKVGTAYAVSCTKTMLYRTESETFDLLGKERNCSFATNNYYRWNLGVWL